LLFPSGGVVVMIGDGVTDMEAKPPAEATIGFGANAVRQRVRDEADWFVHSAEEIRAALRGD
jgi:phosphoserine phosphatase